MKYFCLSDIHSFYTPMITALEEAGFDSNNQEHILIILGDIFDRGPDTWKVYNFIKSLLPDRVILIKGNHETLYQKLLNKNIPARYDYSNGTVRTFCQIAGEDERYVQENYWVDEALLATKSTDNIFAYIDKKIEVIWKRVCNKVRESEITDFINSNIWKNYYELLGYVFVHGWVPLKKDCFYRAWRRMTQAYWDEAMWSCPWELYKQNKWAEDKILVVGHWHTSQFFQEIDNEELYKYQDCPIYNNGRLIGLDACTIRTGRVNILVIEN